MQTPLGSIYVAQLTRTPGSAVRVSFDIYHKRDIEIASATFLNHSSTRSSRSVFPKMPLLSKLRCITIDVTGTLIAYKGELGDYYCMAAKAVGLPCPDYKRMHEGFKAAYTDMAKRYPCFGHAAKMPNIVWWKSCVKDSFIRSGYDYDEETFEKVFRRIYSVFGSSAPYTLFQDSQPFLRWAREQGIIVGLVSNAEYRYQDVILPALGLNEGSEWDFGVFSGLEGVEKPDPRIYEIALDKAGKIAPEETLHIGDSFRKDYLSAKSVGMHALLLDRFKSTDADSWRKSGAVVLPDLMAAQAWLTSEKIDAYLQIFDLRKGQSNASKACGEDLYHALSNQEVKRVTETNGKSYRLK